MKTRSMSNKPDQVDDHQKSEAPQAGRGNTRQIAKIIIQANQLRQKGNATTRGGRAEAAVGSRVNVQRGRAGERLGTLAKCGLVQDAGGDPDNTKFRTALVDNGRKKMVPPPRPKTRGSIAHKQLNRSDIAATSAAPTEVISGNGCDARKTEAEVINKGGPAQEKKRRKREWTCRGKSVTRHFPGNTLLRPTTRARVNIAIQNDLQQHPGERVRRGIPQGPQPMSIDQPSWGMERRENIQGQPVQDTDAVVVSNQPVVKDHAEDENRSRLIPESMPIRRNTYEEFKARMFDYLKSMQDRARMQQDTCILSKQLLDRYGSVAEITEENWQLVTIAALFVASKYEEVWPPQAKDFGGPRFLISEILLTEQALLKALDYKSTIPTPNDYVKRFIKVADSGQEEKKLAFCLANLNLSELEMRYSPAFIAAAAVYAAQCRIRTAPEWTIKLEHRTGYTEGELKNCASLMLQRLQSNVI